jgi:hypothetical protein
MTIEQTIESMKFRLEKLELDMSNLKRKNFEVNEEMKDQVKRSQNNLDQVEKLAGG